MREELKDYCLAEPDRHGRVDYCVRIFPIRALQRADTSQSLSCGREASPAEELQARLNEPLGVPVAYWDG